MNVRKNHADLSPELKTAFVNGVLKLKNDVDSVLHPGEQSRYDDFVELHKNAMIMGPAMFTPMPHYTPLFFPWHRILLRQFELALQQAVGDPNIALPYWDWQRTGKSDPFTADFLGGDGDESENNRVSDGPFAFSAGKFPIRVWDEGPGDAGLRREFGDDPTAWLPTDSEITAGLRRSRYWPGPLSFVMNTEGVLHDPVHRWVGGNLADATSPNDPVFFLHHAFIDRLWERWKKRHPKAPPYRPVSGSPSYDLAATLVFHAPGQRAPWAGTWTVQQTLDPANLGYAYA
jgi:tyrosinase